MVGNGNHYHKRIRRLDHLGLGLNLGNIRRKQISGSYLIFFIGFECVFHDLNWS